MPQLVLGATVETARIPELPLHSSYGPITTDDYTLLWLAAFNKTVKVDFQTLYNFFQGAGGGSFTPVLIGDKYVHVVTQAEAGTQTVNLPAFAGMSFFLERSSTGPLLTTEYEIQNAGGFKLNVPGDLLIQGDRYTLTFYSLQAGPIGGGSSSANKLFKGVVDISTNTTFDVVNHVDKLIRIRGGATKITFTLPDIADISENSLIIIEATIGNTVEQRITTQAGQNIYINNAAKTSIYMRYGEVVWLFRGTDGYYVINDFARVYKELARPFAAYTAGAGELVCNGQIVNRSDYPRLWEYVQTLGPSLVSDATWQTNSATTTGGQIVERPYRGCFSSGDGSTTFRLPDLMNMALRGVKTEAGTDAERFYNKPGGFQKNIVGPHSHEGVPLKTSPHADRGTLSSLFSLDNEGETSQNGAGVGPESRMDNIGVLWVIKA